MRIATWSQSLPAKKISFHQTCQPCTPPLPKQSCITSRLILLNKPLLTGILSLAMVGGLLTSCASRFDATTAESAAPQRDFSSGTEAELVAQDPVDSAQTTDDALKSLPQLVKRAELSLDVETVDETIRQVTAIARGLGGDLLMLQNQTPRDESSPHIASLEIRVPQAQLESALEQLSQLGTVDQQFLTAEDVSSQLVDYEARLRNLRKSEETVLGIMERSGEIGDVLLVAQELRNIRQSIEQIDGELASLRNRVSYSTISLTLKASAPGLPSQTTVITQLGDSWTGATSSVGSFTVSLMQVGIWLLVYSPYWLILAGLGYGTYRVLKGDRQTSESSQET
ncbi:MAG: DUF4349 domain-containing protein [Cyanobacteria bacterium P01_A01_bin.37]